MSELVGIYGASGFGREVLSSLRRTADSSRAFVFIDDGLADIGSLNGIEIVGWRRFRDELSGDRSVVMAIADGQVRRKLDRLREEAGIPLARCQAANVFVGDNVELGPGAVLQPFVMLTSDVKIGRHFHANIYSYVAHDCTIGDYVTFAPRVMCNGNVRIEDDAYIGTGAILRQGAPNKPLVIGRGAIVGMGAVVTKDVAPGTTVVGNPARPLEKK